jgi:hypothetical protein
MSFFFHILLVECGSRYYTDYYTRFDGAIRPYYPHAGVPDLIEVSEHYSWSLRLLR